MKIEVMFLVNVPTEKGIMTRIVTRAIEFKHIIGEFTPDDVAEIKGFYVRLPWQPESPIEFHPRPYYWGT